MWGALDAQRANRLNCLGHPCVLLCSVCTAAAHMGSAVQYGR
jgi:hypothetical protein